MKSSSEYLNIASEANSINLNPTLFRWQAILKSLQ